jgi:hypothetical protein
MAARLIYSTIARTRIERAFDPEAVRRLKATAERGGTRNLPDGVRLDLELLEERRFGNGFAFLRYGG